MNEKMTLQTIIDSVGDYGAKVRDSVKALSDTPINPEVRPVKNKLSRAAGSSAETVYCVASVAAGLGAGYLLYNHFSSIPPKPYDDGAGAIVLLFPIVVSGGLISQRKSARKVGEALVERLDRVFCSGKPDGLDYSLENCTADDDWKQVMDGDGETYPVSASEGLQPFLENSLLDNKTGKFMINMGELSRALSRQLGSDVELYVNSALISQTKKSRALHNGDVLEVYIPDKGMNYSYRVCAAMPSPEHESALSAPNQDSLASVMEALSS